MGFRGTYSALWSPASFWEPEAPLHARKLRLYMLPSSAQVLLQAPHRQSQSLLKFPCKYCQESIVFTGMVWLWVWQCVNCWSEMLRGGYECWVEERIRQGMPHEGAVVCSGA